MRQIWNSPLFTVESSWKCISDTDSTTDCPPETQAQGCTCSLLSSRGPACLPLEFLEEGEMWGAWLASWLPFSLLVR